MQELGRLRRQSRGDKAEEAKAEGSVAKFDYCKQSNLRAKQKLHFCLLNSGKSWMDLFRAFLIDQCGQTIGECGGCDSVLALSHISSELFTVKETDYMKLCWPLSPPHTSA